MNYKSLLKAIATAITCLVIVTGFISACYKFPLLVPITFGCIGFVVFVFFLYCWYENGKQYSEKPSWGQNGLPTTPCPKPTPPPPPLPRRNK